MLSLVALCSCLCVITVRLCLFVVFVIGGLTFCSVVFVAGVVESRSIVILAHSDAA